jgi:hypothetical protein
MIATPPKNIFILKKRKFLYKISTASRDSVLDNIDDEFIDAKLARVTDITSKLRSTVSFS